MSIALRSQLGRRADYTHTHNLKSGRHGWLRLTPAYSVKVVEDLLQPHTRPLRVYDPFCGTGTTALSASCHGHSATTTDINPFLVWLAKAKTARYSKASLLRTRAVAGLVAAMLRTEELGFSAPPPIHNIDRWWSRKTVAYLCSLRSAIEGACERETSEQTLLLVAFCRTLMRVSNAAFNHQSMSFKAPVETPDVGYAELNAMFLDDVAFVVTAAEDEPAGTASVILGDAREAATVVNGPFDLVITSPPYANRMSYIRELRPYMYWLGYLQNGRDAGELDWTAIGGTWGIATSRLTTWEKEATSYDDPVLQEAVERIALSGNANGPLLGRYVAKYHDDIWRHLQSLTAVLAPGAKVNYIVGNSTFYGVLVSVEKYYAEMLRRLGFADVRCVPLRKRNSKKELIEFNVAGTWVS